MIIVVKESLYRLFSSGGPFDGTAGDLVTSVANWLTKVIRVGVDHETAAHGAIRAEKARVVISVVVGGGYTIRGLDIDHLDVSSVALITALAVLTMVAPSGVPMVASACTALTDITELMDVEAMESLRESCEVVRLDA